MSYDASQPNRGFALLVAVIFMSVMLVLGLVLSSLAYKQLILSSVDTESQYAFYAADGALECALYADSKESPNPFATLDGVNNFSCQGVGPASEPQSFCIPSTDDCESAGTIESIAYMSLDNGAHCADITVYKPIGSTSDTTYLFSQGYDIPCSSIGTSGGRFISRGIQASY